MENLENEVWRDVIGHERYQVSTLGRVKSPDLSWYTDSYRRITRKGKILKSTIVHGYGIVGLYNGKNKNPKFFRVHRLVAVAFIENKENKPEVNHKDGDKLNNNLNNLEWCTSLENQRHAIETGLYVNRTQGERNGSSKFTEPEIRKVRQLFKSKIYTQREIAKICNIDFRYITSIVNNKCWKHIL